MRLKIHLQNIYLQEIYGNLVCIKGMFQHSSFQHVFRERNTQGDGLSKIGLQEVERNWHLWEHINDTIMEHDPGLHS